VKNGGASLELAQGPNLVSSAADIANPGNEVQSKEGGTPRPNPVALEVMVNVTGTKSSGQSRELFSEETVAVLVFRDGAVIRLNAAVSAGQLVFLTNKNTNQEVVCQVLRKRGCKPTTCYVELQFTEERSDYWGVAFPEGQKSTAEFKVVEQVQAEEVTAEESEMPVTPRSAEDVEQLKREVEALREQLKALEKKNVEEVEAKAAEAAAAREAAKLEAAVREAEKSAQASAAANVAKRKEELAAVNDPTPVRSVVERKAELLMPPAEETTQAPRAVVGMTLPTQKKEVKTPEVEAPREAAEELLPEPELDFSQVPKNGGGATRAMRMPLLGSKARVRGLSAVLAVVVVGAIWYTKLWVYLPLPIGKKAVAEIVARPAVTTRNVEAENAKTADATNAGAALDSKDEKSVTSEENAAAAPTRAEEKVADVAPKKAGAAREKSFEKKDSAESAGETNAETVASDAPVLPAKLLKAANPVYPPEAMTNYITGDVKAEVAVDASGRVGEVKVILGPQALREAAVQALKQYEYAPATQGGKAVGSKAVEVVKFWFNP
jgi:TonB family protein